MPKNDSLRTTVMRSLIAIGSEQEAGFYVDIFQNLAPEKFALIVIDPCCLEKPLLDALISDLKVLSNLDLTPVLLVGALDRDKTSVRFQGERLYKELDRAKIKTARLDCASYQLVPDVRRKAQSGYIVVLEMTDAKRGLDLKELAARLEPAKMVFLQPSGGFRINGKRVVAINVDQAGAMPSAEQLSGGQQKFINVVAGLMSGNARNCTYVIVSPLNLLSELFTVRGAGTMLRRGAEIRCATSYGRMNMKKLTGSIETSFGRKLCADYLSRPVTQICLEENYRGGAIMTELAGLSYLSKFWVTQEAQGEGIGSDIWQSVLEKTPAFFWRSKNDNPFNNWYMKMCEGMQLSGDWRVFWIGLEAPEIPGAVLAAANAPQDFE
ncbi:MAG: hypothetical protein JKY25_03350 [Robiginitomaculum sp.]|nr:hypothetical protein [Robiginitomaculum sp.]